MQPKKIQTRAKKWRVRPRARKVAVHDFKFWISMVYCIYWRFIALAIFPSCSLILFNWLNRISFVAYSNLK